MLLVPCFLFAEQWTTHFAYNNVTQIAMTPDKVYALSDGSLYSVEKQTDKIQVYNRQSGLHSTGISCIYYDDTSKQLIIGYATGKIDLLTDNGVTYIGELYDKDMTQRKTINNITIAGHTAYLSTAFGIQTLNMRTNHLANSYWLRPGGLETDVQDVLIAHDSIYAFTSDSLFCAALKDNIVDYTVWKRELRSGRIAPDPDKGVHYTDFLGHWYAGHADGITRITPVGQTNYKPQGPLSNIPYRMTADQGNVWIVQGGRWAVQYFQPGMVMRFDRGNWHNISTEDIAAKLPGRPILDFMNTAVDPQDKNHYFVTSYGTGLYEFQDDVLVHYYTADGTNALQAPSSDYTYYTRLDGATFDAQGNLWILNAGEVNNQLACLDKDGEWHAVRIILNGELTPFHTPAGMVMDHQNPHYKWIANARAGTLLCLIDDKGEPFNDAVHQTMRRDEWIDQNGTECKPGFIYCLRQTNDGRIWLGTDIGVIILSSTDFFTSDACLRLDFADEFGETPLLTQTVNALCQTNTGDIWIGTKERGVYVLNAEASQIKAHYTIDNSAMPNMNVLSLAYEEQQGIMFIGTSEGLVSYSQNGGGEGLMADEQSSATEMDEGTMQRWKLHFSYTNPQEIAVTHDAVFAMADGALFSVYRSDETITYWNKSTGLSGTSVVHIGYDPSSQKMIIAYADGRLDLIDKKGNVQQMPDLSIKAGAVPTSILCLASGKQCSYAGTEFGIMVINAHKGEISDTYYIGHESAAMKVHQIVEMGDTLYAFSYDTLFKASLHDNLVDYTVWQSEALPCAQVQQAGSWSERIYTIQHDSIYRRDGKDWTLVSPDKINWLHANDGRMLVYKEGQGLFEYQDDGSFVGITDRYTPNDAIYTNGQYWLGVSGKGLVRLGKEGDDFFTPEGPLSNFGYRVQEAHGQVYVAPGGRWAEQFGRQSDLSIYDGKSWRGIPWPDTWYYTDHDIRDAVSFGIDPKDAGHFYVATYGTGVFEYKDYKAVAHYDEANSTLRGVTGSADTYYFTRTDAAMTDDQGNFWVLNATESGKPLHVRTTDGIWHGLNMYSSGKSIVFNTPGAMMTDRRNKDYKWMIDQRVEPGVFLHYDGGTPTVEGDDYTVKRSSFTDQRGILITPEYIYCIAQDHTNRLWIGTQQGVLLIPANVDFFTSDACQRIIIPRNDGTGLGDYLLGDEQIKCMAVDGGNRMWIGTANSGLYLIEDDTITVAHFTENNSLLPANAIQSITIEPNTGEVFVGTDRGIASYRSDASEPQKDMSQVYAYPNPVKPNYTGVISITGLMDNTVVNIIDESGNLVCKTRSHGGTAVWDGNNAYGQRATPGVYTALCNAESGHTVVKILFIR